MFWNVDPSTHKNNNNCTWSHQGFTEAYQGFIRAATVCNSLCTRKRNRDAVKTAVDNVKSQHVNNKLAFCTWKVQDVHLGHQKIALDTHTQTCTVHSNVYGSNIWRITATYGKDTNQTLCRDLAQFSDPWLKTTILNQLQSNNA